MATFILFLQKQRIKIYGIVLFATTSIACNKLVQIGPPVSTISSVQVFDDSADALSALQGIYVKIVDNGSSNFTYGDGTMSIYLGSSADEILGFAGYLDNDLNYNVLTAYQDGSFIDATFWQPAYQVIYQANALIAGVQASTGISQAVKNEYIGEALFFRAFTNFYQVNLFGPVPIITTTDYSANALASRNSVMQVYQAIISDLKMAQSLLPGDYSAGGGQRIRANAWAAAALLSRAYLFNQEWDSAEITASNIINNSSLFSLDSNLNNVFLANNPEAILQWNMLTAYPPYNATVEGYNVIPYNNTTNPNIYLNQQLLNAFESGDLRWVAWIDSTNYQGTTYYYPFKYNIGPAQAAANNPATQYYTVLRLAEQFLIRAEARAQQNNLQGAISDLNVIRGRAGLPPLPFSLTQSQVFTSILQERRIEFFAEWGHRWLDLKRSGSIDSVMSIATPLKGGGTNWQDFQKLYPIPFNEMQESPNFTQNQGY